MTTFYGDTLGLPFVKRYGSLSGAEYQAGNLTLAIMRTEDFGGTFSRNAMPIALQVGDVAVARERLEAMGVRFVSYAPKDQPPAAPWPARQEALSRQTFACEADGTAASEDEQPRTRAPAMP